MNQFTINVQVNLGLTTELYDLIKPIAASLLDKQSAPVAKSTKRAPKATTAQAPQTEEKPVEAVVEDPAPAAETEATTAADSTADSATKEYTEEDVRAAMDSARRRVEGENYKDKTDSYGYKTWHRRLTAYFKETAAECGADKPSALPNSDSRQRFIERCSNVRIENDDITDCPF